MEKEKETREYIIHLLQELSDQYTATQAKKVEIYNRILNLMKIYIEEEVKKELENG